MLFPAAAIILASAGLIDARSVAHRHVEYHVQKRDDATATTLAANAIQSGSFVDGSQEIGAKEVGQAKSATSTNNFINICSGKTLTNGLQILTGSCNGIPMGDIPAKTAMVSSIITFPISGSSSIQSDTTFNITVQMSNIVSGSFTNADATYYAAPQALSGGKIVGHTHVTVQSLGSTISPKTALDPTLFAFFKGINTPADSEGVLTATVTGGLPAGNYRVCTLAASSNHQPVLMPVAQRGSADDCTKFTVSGTGTTANAAANNQSGGLAAAAAAASAVAAGPGAIVAQSSSTVSTTKAATASKAATGSNSNSNKNNGGTKASSSKDAAAAKGATATKVAASEVATSTKGATSGGSTGTKGTSSGKGASSGNSGSKNNGGSVAAAAASASSSPCVSVVTGTVTVDAAAETATSSSKTKGKSSASNSSDSKSTAAKVANASATTTASAAGATTSASSGSSSALGGIAAPAVTNSGDSTRPFEVNGNTFVNEAAAKQRSCDIQFNLCADAVNGGTASGFTIADCSTQETTCNSS